MPGDAEDQLGRACDRALAAQAAVQDHERDGMHVFAERDAAIQELRAVGMGATEISRLLSIDRQTIYKILRRVEVVRRE